MNLHEAQTALQNVENLSEFARKGNLPYRTLMRIKDGRPAHRTTLVLLGLQLKRLKPKQKTAPAVEPGQLPPGEQ